MITEEAVNYLGLKPMDEPQAVVHSPFLHRPCEEPSGCFAEHRGSPQVADQHIGVDGKPHRLGPPPEPTVYLGGVFEAAEEGVTPPRAEGLPYKLEPLLHC